MSVTSFEREERMTLDELRSAIARIEYLLNHRSAGLLDPGMRERLKVYRQYLHQVETNSNEREDS